MTKEEKELQIKDIREDLDRVSAIESLSNTKGGKIFIGKLVNDIISSVDILCLKYGKLTLQEFVGLCADMNVKLDLIRTIKKARKSKKIATEDLKKAIEALED